MLNWFVSTFKIQMAYFQIESLSIASGHLPVPHIGAMQILSKCIKHIFSTGNILIPLEIPTKHCTFFLMCIIGLHNISFQHRSSPVIAIQIVQKRNIEFFFQYQAALVYYHFN